MSNPKFETVAAANSWTIPHQPQPVSLPIYATSSFVLPDVDHAARLFVGGEEGYLYSRRANPTIAAAAKLLNELEGGESTLLFPSGMAAISTSLMALLKAGDHVVAPKVKYGGTHSLLENTLPNYGIEISLVDNDIDAYRNAVKANTKILYGETPCNPLMNILDLEEFGRLGKSLQITTMVDSTFATPFIQNPILLGVDVVLHSCSKYLGGHSDILAGAMITSSKQIASKIVGLRKMFGSCLSPFDGFLLMRGIRTLPVRMERHCSNAMTIAQFLESHPKVDRVYYPGLTSHPGHVIAVKQMRLFGGMLAFEVKGTVVQAKKFTESLNLFKLAVSLGGTDSVVSVVTLMTHNDIYITPEEKEAIGISENLIRLGIGLEHVEDLKKDIEQALASVP